MLSYPSPNATQYHSKLCDNKVVKLSENSRIQTPKKYNPLALIHTPAYTARPWIWS